MKNVSSLEPNETNSPKTPGGISKSLLTPCRRLGLSRNWRKSGPSPFKSPLASSNSSTVDEKPVTIKRKGVGDENKGNTDCSIENEVEIDQIEHTPSRNIVEPRRKKSKILIEAINTQQDQDFNRNSSTESKATDSLNTTQLHNTELDSTPVCTKGKSRTSSLKADNYETKLRPKSLVIDQSIGETSIDDTNNSKQIQAISTPVRTKSKWKNLHSPSKNKMKDIKAIPKSKDEIEIPLVPTNNPEKQYTIKKKSPNELRKECIVVIQRKLFKNIEKQCETINKDNNLPGITDSDSDDVPLISIQNQNSVKSISKVNVDEDDDDFSDNKSFKAKLKKSKDIKSPKEKPKTINVAKSKTSKVQVDRKPTSQNSFDDDDDVFDNKRTILIRKTYEKVSKPSKAKSTGSITQRDIDNLRHRIENKKKLLLAQSITPDTEELRNLIKEWQKGCQNALIELLDLMRNKFPEKQTMDYSGMLQTLKIPASLVGYDSDNDCFVSPDDTSIILGQIKDL